VPDAADEQGARCIVVGSRGRSGGRALVLGSVSNAIVHHGARPVLVVPAVDSPGGS
jgi:nucleotide-binding universal stress UspA family protein